MLYRETGQFKTSYRRDQAIFPIVQDRWCVAFVLVAAYGVVPALANEYWLQAVLIPFLVYALAAIGLNLLTAIPVSCPSAPADSWRWAPTPPTN